MQKLFLTTAVLFFTAQIALSQNWALTTAGTNNWVCVASSANGNTLIAGQWTGCIEISTNAGATWTTNAITTDDSWNSVASSADGTKLLAADAFVGIYLSTNSGETWISNSLPNFYWGSVAMSADGNTLAAVAPSATGSLPPLGAVFSSTNAGASWISNNLANTSVGGEAIATSVAMSADGSKIFVAAPPIVCYSTNFGTSWMQMTSAPPLSSSISPSQAIASSADGNKLILCNPTRPNYVTGVFISTNSGTTWTMTSLPQSYFWSFVASSADGKTLMASSGNAGPQGPNPVCISTNSGASWTSDTNENWAGVACSADGGVRLAAAASGTIVGDANISGAIFESQSTQPPLLNVAPVSGDLQLSWLIPSTDFVLEQSADLNNWSAVTNTPALNLANLNEQITVSPTNGAGFYRLVH